MFLYQFLSICPACIKHKRQRARNEKLNGVHGIMPTSNATRADTFFIFFLERNFLIKQLCWIEKKKYPIILNISYSKEDYGIIYPAHPRVDDETPRSYSYSICILEQFIVSVISGIWWNVTVSTTYIHISSPPPSPRMHYNSILIKFYFNDLSLAKVL